MKKNFIITCLMLIFSISTAFGQKSEQAQYRKISEMIADSQRMSGIFANLLGGSAVSDNAETTNISAINFPNSVRVKYVGETQKMSSSRKKAVDTWLKNYAKRNDDKRFYINEIQVEENGEKYWIMAHENNVVARLKASAKPNDEVVLKMKILGSYRKGKTVDYFLLADGVE